MLVNKEFGFAARTFLDFSNSLSLSTELKTGNCFAASQPSPFFLRALKKKKNRKKVLKLVFHTISFHVTEKSVIITSRLLFCVCTFLLVDKIVYGRPRKNQSERTGLPKTGFAI